MNTTKILRRVLGMPASEHRPRLVEPILRGIAHPHTALTEAELAQVRADLELAEPKKCQRLWRKSRSDVASEVACEQRAVVQRLMVCGEFDYRCEEHMHQLARFASCKCGWRGEHVEDHIAAVLPL